MSFKCRVLIQQNELKNIEDASDEIALLDDDEKIPYLVGEVFIYQNLENTQVNPRKLTTNIKRCIFPFFFVFLGIFRQC